MELLLPARERFAGMAPSATWAQHVVSHAPRHACLTFCWTSKASKTPRYEQVECLRSPFTLSGRQIGEQAQGAVRLLLCIMWD